MPRLGQGRLARKAMIEAGTAPARLITPSTPSIFTKRDPFVPVTITPGDGAILRKGVVGPDGVIRPVPVVEERYDIYGQPVTTPTAPVVDTVPGAPGVGLDWTTVAMIGGSLLVLMLLMRK